MRERFASLLRGVSARSPPPAVLALAAAVLLLPLWAVVAPGGLALLTSPGTGIVLATALVAAPAAAAFPASLRGFRRMVFTPPDGVERVLLAAAMLAYAIGLGAVVPYGEAVARCVVVAALGLACAWLFLLHAIVDPAPSPIRRAVAVLADAGLVSAFLHAGDFLTAAWVGAYPMLAVRDYGWPARLAGFAGFAVVAATTAFWQRQPFLCLGLLAAIALVPAYAARKLRAAAALADAANEAETARSQVVAGLGEGVRESLRAVLRAGARLDRTGLSPEDAEIVARMRLGVRAALVQADDIPTFAAIEAGDFAPETRAFDLYQLAHGAVASLRPQAADRGTSLTVRIDPRLPYELRGWPHQLRQLLICLVAVALRGSERAAIAVQLDLVELAGDRVRLRMSVREHGGRPVYGAPERDPAIAAADRLAGAMGGSLHVAGAPCKGREMTADLPFMLDRAMAALLLDLDRLPVMIVTEDSGFAAELGAALRTWRAAPRWIGAGDAAFAHVEALIPEAERPALVVDGRDDVLGALSWAHRAIRANPAAAPYVLFVAAEARIDSVIGLADGVLDAILSAPFTPGVLQSTLHALRVGTADWFPAEPLPPPVVLPEPLPPPAPPPEDETVELSVPLPVAPRPPAAPAPRLPPQILVAATNAMNRKIIEQIMIGAKCTAHLVAGAEQAGKMLTARPIDLVLLDLAAATFEEAAAVERLRAAHPDLPIVVLSGDPDPEAPIVLAAAGASMVLGKPLEPRRLTAAIEQALPRPPLPPAAEPAQVTEISSHPRFARPPVPAAIDRRAVEALWSLGGGTAFFQDVIEAFRADSRQILKELGGAAAVCDLGGFSSAIQALRNCTASVGGTHLREALLAMQQIGAAELRDKGAIYVQQLAGEIERLDEVLAEYRKTAE
ncbi:MAG TPA: response regulator [Stellaceae bacterium]|nr:response regulator [Stellaceae bacterium]